MSLNQVVEFFWQDTNQNMLRDALGDDFSIKESYVLTKIAKSRELVAEVTWCQLPHTKTLSRLFLKDLLSNQVAFRSLSEDQLKAAFAQAHQALSPAELQASQDNVEASLKALRENNCAPLRQENVIAPLANPTLEPWQHPALIDALVKISCVVFERSISDAIQEIPVSD